MCGICGWYNKNGKVNTQVLNDMNQAGRHRGPDDEGYAIIENNRVIPCIGEESIGLPYADIRSLMLDDITIGFGHRRLSIIDLSAQGHQPMISESDGICLTFNGEIYNYLELQNELRDKGHCFNSESDTEVLLHSYKEWGEECVNHLNGMWAFAIYDSNKESIFCSRDRLGAKPFYYYMDDDNFIFASEIKQLVKNPLIPRRINEELLITHIMWSITDFSEDTLIKDIKSLEGGHNLSIKISTQDNVRGIADLYKYWDIKTDGEKDEAAIKEAFECHDNAVKIRTRSDVPIGILLSGGLDSSSLVAEIADYYRESGRDPKEINTYTSCYEGFAEGDEREYAEIVNEHCGVSQNLIYPDADDTYSVFRDMIWYSEGLCSFYSMGSFLTIKRISELGTKVIINGQGSDETMFGYERYYTWYLMDCLHRQGTSSFLKEFRKATNNSKLSSSQLLKYLLYFNNLPVRKARCRKRMKPYVTSYVLKSFENNHSVDKYLEFKNLADMQYNEIRGTQLTHILRGDDRSFMAHSIESRVPFIDYRYIEKAVQIPESLKINDGYTKYLLRKNIEKKLPGRVVWRKTKMGWPSPAKRWISRLDKEKVEQLFVNPRSEKYFNIAEVRNLWDKNPEAFAVEKFLSVEIFMRLFDATAE